MTAAAKLDVRERPILFSAPMVRAILAGRKTMTRRVAKPQPVLGDGGCWYPEPPRKPAHRARHYANEAHLRRGLPIDFCPYGRPGDLLWVRETWGYRGAAWSNRRPDHHELSIAYQADGTKRSICRSADDWSGVPKQRLPPEPTHDEDWVAIENRDAALDRYWKSWRPSIHMPRWASRITLRVTSVRVERLQDISEEDARAEGVSEVLFRPDDGYPLCYGYMVGADDGKTPLATSAREAFRGLWESINGPESWAANPWVWCIQFSRVTP